MVWFTSLVASRRVCSGNLLWMSLGCLLMMKLGKQVRIKKSHDGVSCSGSDRCVKLAFYDLQFGAFAVYSIGSFYFISFFYFVQDGQMLWKMSVLCAGLPCWWACQTTQAQKDRSSSACGVENQVRNGKIFFYGRMGAF